MSETFTLPSGQPAPMKDGDFTPAAQSQVVTWNMKRLAPPSPLYVTVDDVLRAGAATSTVNEVVTVSYRLLRADTGKIVLGQFTVHPASDRSLAIQDNPLTEGFLLSVSCKAAQANRRGITFVRLFLNPKALGAGQPGLMMMADYVTQAMAPGYPNGRTTNPTEGPGVVYPVFVANPAAGTDWAVSVPPNALWNVQSVTSLLTCSAAVANRNVLVHVTNGVTERFTASANHASTASSTDRWNWFQAGNTGFNGLNQVNAPWPASFRVAIGDSIGTVTLGMQAADQWSSICLWVEEWLENV